MIEYTPRNSDTENRIVRHYHEGTQRTFSDDMNILANALLSSGLTLEYTAPSALRAWETYERRGDQF